MQDWWQNVEVNVQDVIRSLPPVKCTSENWIYEAYPFKIEGSVASFKLNDIRGANGLSNKLTSALTDMAVELHSRPDVKVLVVTAGGAYFCTGGAFGGNTADDDMLFATPPDPTLSELDQSTSMNMPTAKIFYLLNTLPQYKVAAIRGKNMGAGNSLIASMDFVYAPDTKKTGLSFMESTRGLSFCMSWQGILSKIGVPKARGVVLMSDEVDANGGKEIGIVDEVVEGASADAAMRKADELAALKGAEIAKLSHEEIQKIKTTGPGGTKTKLLEVPTAARGCQALQGPVPDYQVAIKEVIAKCSRSGRPAPARLSKEMWEHENVQFERAGQHMAVLRLKNGEAGNKLDRAMVHALLDAAVELHKSAGKVRLVCVYAEGDSFCSGLGADVSPQDEELQQLLFLFWMLPMYCLGFVDGKVSGYGVAFCSTFDAVVARTSAEFDFSGLTAQNGGEFVSSRIGAPVLEELSRSKAKKTAEEARAMSLVFKVVTSKQGMKDHMESVCNKLSACAPNAVSESKAVLQTVGSKSIDMSVLHFMSEHIAKRNMDPEFNDAIMAITMPTHKPAYNRHEHSAVLPQHKVSGDSEAPFLLKEKPKKTKATAAALSVMI